MYPISRPLNIDWTRTPTEVHLTWRGASCSGERAQFDLTMSTDGSAPEPVVRRQPKAIEHRFENLPPGVHTVEVRTRCGDRLGPPAVATFETSSPPPTALFRSSPEMPGDVGLPGSHRTALPTPAEETRSGASTRLRECRQPTHHDHVGDGTIDIASITVESNCHTVWFTLTTHRPFTDADLEEWTILLGSKYHRGVDCGLMTDAVIVRGGSRLDAQIYPLRQNARTS